MIDEARTLEIFGYTSDELSKGSHKNIVAVCEECGRYRVIRKQVYRDLCHKCALGKANKKRAAPPDYNVLSIDDSETFKRFGHHAYDLSPNSGEMVVAVCVGCGQVRETPKQFCADLCRSCTDASDINHRKVSAGRQGISYDEWEGFAINSPYCPKFNESCRESNREKYGRRCFITGKPESENITKTDKALKLSVHHVDMNKEQGCNGHTWKLVPLGVECHGTAHGVIWAARIEYLLEYVWYPNGVWTPDALC